ncbi:hypothetical protein ACET3X_002855 [Alternaria dauci]|uniref:ADP-ribose 1''-phosphate phosphatase n=1 Tax=Alternaria dauci TaxID=48095 RepID=A0ABR3UQV3_9PLEO
MSPQDSDIRCYFVPKEGTKSTTATGESEGGSTGQPPMPTAAEPKDKVNSKRKLSQSSTPVLEKRQDTGRSENTTSPRHFSHKNLSPDQFSPSSLSSERPSTALALTHHTGNIFAAPPHTLLIHACNVQGAWGSGIAKAFKDAYPKAYAIYHAFCTKEHLLKSRPVPTGTALLIPPVDAGNQHWIGCLFTSAKYGKAKDKPDVIVGNTKPAMEMLLELVKMAGGIESVRMCKINSGKFGVDWKRTKGVLEEIVVRDDWKGTVEVWDPETK